MKVLLDARVEPGVSGGVYQVIRSLARELARSPEPDVDVTLLADPGSELAAIGLPISAISAGAGFPGRAAARLIPGARWAHRVTRAARRHIDQPPIDTRAFDVVHLALQRGFSSSAPTVFSPYDLQHLHLPEMFDAVERRDRSYRYRELGRRADAVIVMNRWTASDVVEQLEVEPERVFVVPPGITQPLPPEQEIDAGKRTTQSELAPGADFALYPAQTWPHKNHLGLGRAVQQLRAEGLEVPIVCPGHPNRNHRHVRAGLAKMGVDDLMLFPGYVSDSSMEDLYRRARVLIFPSLFEGWGMPIFEAMARCLPVACSDVCGLRDTTGGAAMLFDPRRPESIAAALESLWVDEPLRGRLQAAGLQVAGRHTWAGACARLRSIYKLVGGADLSEADEHALAQARSWQG